MVWMDMGMLLFEATSFGVVSKETEETLLYMLYLEGEGAGVESHIL